MFSAAARKIDHFFGRGEAEGMFQQAAQATAERGAGHDRTAEGVFDYRIIGAANFQRAFAGANVQAGETQERGIDDQFAGEADFGDLG